MAVRRFWFFAKFPSRFLAKTNQTHQNTFRNFNPPNFTVQKRNIYVSGLNFNTHEQASYLTYPEARRDENAFDYYFGVKVSDPYRWLENPNSAETQRFIAQQNCITRPYLDACSVQHAIKKRFIELWDYPKYSCPCKIGKSYCFFKSPSLRHPYAGEATAMPLTIPGFSPKVSIWDPILANTSVMYMQESLTSEPWVLVDVSSASIDGSVALLASSFSDDASTFAYCLSSRGSDWTSIHLKDVKSGRNYPEVLKRVKFTTMAWTKDNKGLFYSRYPKSRRKHSVERETRGQKLYYHRLNTPQCDDVLVVEFPDNPFWRIGAEVSDCGRYLIVRTMKDCSNNMLFFADLSLTPEINKKLDLTTIVNNFEADYEYITNEGSVCIIRTNRNAPNYRLVQIDLNHPEEENWTTLIQEHPMDVLDWASAVDNDKLVLHYVRDVKSVLQLHSLENGELIQNFVLPVGTIQGFFGQRNQSEIFYKFVSFLTPGTIYHVDFNQKPPYQPVIFKEIKVEGFDPSQYRIKQIFYLSKDGTNIPMFIVGKKSLKNDGSNPLLLYGYGGFNVKMQPSFCVTQCLLMENFNGFVALANIRGGGEYGDKWHKAGRLLNKQNAFDDFQAAAEYLIAERYTQPSKLVIEGGSNGGLLVAVCINQRPELFGAAIIRVGVLDMLRYQKFTIGHAWVSDYGSPNDEIHFKNLLKYSPLHNIPEPSRGQEYPATLVLTSDSDDRVVPLHSLKFIAALQYAAQGSNQSRPMLARIDTKSGHGGGKTTDDVINENTDILCFIVQALELNYQH